MKKYSLIKTFTLFSMIAFILTGIILSFIISGHIKDDKMANLEEAAQFAVKTVVRRDLEATDLDSSISGSKEERIKSELYDLMDKYGLKSVTLINSKKAVIIPGDSDFTERQMDVNLDRVLHAEVPFSISNVYRINNAGGKEDKLVLNIYEPILFNGKVEGVFVLQIPEQAISNHVSMIIQAVVLTLSGGLLVLFLLLIGVLYRTSKTLLKQNEELTKQKAEIEMSYKRLEDSYKSSVSALSNAVDARDTYTAGHSSRVTKIALLLSKELNMSKEDRRVLEYAALFHDIGKIGIPDRILNKNGKLTKEEYELIKKHPDIGVNILEKVDFLTEALPIIRHHHERFCGNGYPSGIKGEEIPLGARIIAIADTYDAMTTDRPYRKAFDHDAAIQEILKNKGSQFDDMVVDVFMRIESIIKNSADSVYEEII